MDGAKVENIQEEVIKTVAEQLGLEANKVTPTASFTGELGADSLDVVEMVMALETKFQVEIPDDDTEKITNVEQAVAYLQEKLASR